MERAKKLAVVGSLQSRSYDDKRYPDVKHFVTEIRVEKVSFTGEKKKSESESNQQQTYVPPPQDNFSDFEQIGDGNLPF